MARGSFNTTCDIYFGPGTLTPGVLKGTAACRLVLQDAIFVIGVDSPIAGYYMTIIDIIPIGMWSPPFLSVDPELSDQVAIPSGTAAQYWVLWTESILWQSHPIYYRGHLEFLPLPGDPSVALELGGIVLTETAGAVLLE